MELTRIRAALDAGVPADEMTVYAQETNMCTLGMYNNTDLSHVRPDPETGEVSFATAVRPATQCWRVFAVFADGAGVPDTPSAPAHLALLRRRTQRRRARH